MNKPGKSGSGARGKSRAEWTLPHRPRAPLAEDEFCASAGAIWDEYRERKRRIPPWGERGLANGKARPSPPPFDTPNSFFKRQSYGLLYRYVLRPEDRAVIRKLVMRSTYQPERPRFKDNFFHWGLVAIYLVEGVAGARGVAAAKKAIGRMGKEMAYAHFNRVPPEHLIGFIYQSACSERIGQLLRLRSQDPSLTFQLVEPSLT